MRTKWQQSACDEIIEQTIQSKDTAVIILEALSHDGGIANSSCCVVKINKKSTAAIYTDSTNPQCTVLSMMETGSNRFYQSGKKKGQPKLAKFSIKMGVRKCHAFNLGENPKAFEQSGMKSETLLFDKLKRKTEISLYPSEPCRSEAPITCAAINIAAKSLLQKSNFGPHTRRAMTRSRQP